MLYLRIPERTRVHDINMDGITSTSSRLSSFTEVTINTTRDADVTLRVTGHASDVKAGPAVNHEWRVGSAKRQSLSASAPEVLYDPSVIRFVFGPGLLVRTDDHIDFTVSDGHLLITNDSRIRTTASVGALFSVREFMLREMHPIDILVSIDFSPDTDRAVDGIIFGGAVGLIRVKWHLGRATTGMASHVSTAASAPFRLDPRDWPATGTGDRFYRNAYRAAHEECPTVD